MRNYGNQPGPCVFTLMRNYGEFPIISHQGEHTWSRLIPTISHQGKLFSLMRNYIEKKLISQQGFQKY